MTKYITVSDVHMNYAALQRLHDIPEYNLTDTQIVFLGDYLDGAIKRHNHTGLKTIQFIQNEIDNHQAIALMGNHDQFLINSLYGSNFDYQVWTANGGHKTLRDLGVHTSNQSSIMNAFSHGELRQVRDFYDQLSLYHMTDEYIFVHAGINWANWNVNHNVDTNMELQAPDDLIWIRDEGYINQTNLSNHVIVAGHTPTYFWQEYATVDQAKQIFNTFPIVKFSNAGKDMYQIDGGSKSGVIDSGINIAIFENQSLISAYKLTDDSVNAVTMVEIPTSGDNGKTQN